MKVEKSMVQHVLIYSRYQLAEVSYEWDNSSRCRINIGHALEESVFGILLEVVHCVSTSLMTCDVTEQSRRPAVLLNGDSI